MSFASPALLIALVLVPVGLLLYARGERRRARAAARFATPATLPSVAPRRPGWRRHAPLALYGLAMTALIVALARPQASVAVPVERASIVLATDHSGSMQATDVAPSRIEATRRAAEAFLARVPERVRVGGVVFDHRAESVLNPTTDRPALRSALRAAMRPSGGTAIGDALVTSLAMLRGRAGSNGKRPPGAILLLSDGTSTHGREPLAQADAARRLGVPVYTVALGTAAGTLPGGEPVPPDPQTLREIAERSGGRAFTAGEAAELSAVYERLGSHIATRREQRELTGAFAGGAILVLALGSGLSLRWFRRLL